MMMMMILVV